MSNVLTALFEAAPVVLTEAQLASSAATSQAVVHKSREFFTGFTVDVILQCAIIAYGRGVEHIEEEIDLMAAVGSGFSNTISFGSGKAEQALAASVDGAANCLFQSLGASTRSEKLADCSLGAASALISRAISNLPKGPIIQLGKLTQEQLNRLARWAALETSIPFDSFKMLLQHVKFQTSQTRDAFILQLQRIFRLQRSGNLRNILSSLPGTLTPQAIADIESILLRQEDAFFERLSRESGLAQAFVNDLKDNSLRAAMVARPELGRAWGVLPAKLRTDVPNLLSVSRFIAAKNINPAIIGNEIGALSEFRENLLRGLDISTGSQPLPSIKNKLGYIDTDGYLLGQFVNGQFVPSGSSQVAGSWDYVVKTDGQIFVGRKHTFMSNGESVLAAGEIKFNNGRMTDINNLSGHYQPTPGEGMNFLRAFQQQGVNTDGIFLSMYNADGTIFKQIHPNANARILYEQ